MARTRKTPSRALEAASRAATALALGALCAAGLLGSLGAGVASAETRSFTTAGSFSLTVPPGVTSVTVSAVGAAGGRCESTGTAGMGASVASLVTVAAGTTLSGTVGGPGANCPYEGGGGSPEGGAGGAGGGGAGGAGHIGGPGGAGGGGASSVSTTSGPLVVAAGGGGGSFDIAGGNAGSVGANGTGSPTPGGGGAGSAVAGGTGGAPGTGGTTGGTGVALLGGTGGAGSSSSASAGGGGGGGGYFGGGGGGGSTPGAFGGGGGGGSSFVAQGALSAAPTAEASHVTITYTVLPPPSVATTTPANGATYTLGQVVAASYSCTDGAGAPGIASCAGLVAIGAPIDTSTLGAHSFTVTATSKDGLTTTASVGYTVVTPTAPPVEKGKPRVNTNNGEVTTEYEFPESGEATQEGKVPQGASLARVLGASALAIEDPFASLALNGNAAKKAKKCKKGFVKKGKSCVNNAPVLYGRTKLLVSKAGAFKLVIKPSGKVLAALKKGKTLTVALTLTFTPAGTTVHITKSASVKVHLKPKKKGKGKGKK
jgi:hypothetical protein